MEFEFHNDSPVYLQIAELIENRIVSGQYAPGQKLPSVREFAVMTRTNPNTVQKAMQELESRGLIATKRTSGKFVADQAAFLEESRRRKAEEATEKYLLEMKSLGFDGSEIAELVSKGMKKNES